MFTASKNTSHQEMLRLKVRKNGQPNACNFFCNIAAKQVEKPCCTFYHPHQTYLATNQVVNRFGRG